MKRLPIILALAITGVGACANESTTDDGTLTVAVAFYPIEEIVRRVGRSDVEIISLVPPGSEAHEYEPTAKQITRLENADIIYFLGSGFQPNLEKAIDSLPSSVYVVNVMDYMLPRTENGEVDPHVWLDPENMQLMARVVAETLGDADPTRRESFAHNEASYFAELAELDDELTDGLANCAAPVLITTHEAFAYLAHAYGLTYRAIAGVSPGDEPSAKSLEDLAEFAAQHDVTTVFYEKDLPPELAETVAREIGANTSGLSTAESLTESQLDAGESYLSIMRDNLQALRAGLGCA